MQLYKTKAAVLVSHENDFYASPLEWDILINRKNLHAFLSSEIKNWKKISHGSQLIANELLAPIGTQEVWAAGVTYYRSMVARAEESKQSGGSTFYDKVYEAERPEIFFKATPHRVANPTEEVFIRKDSTWNVPEPELTLYINSAGTIEGYTVGNDMSSRSIEGENPLYLPQAKTYDRSAALGPCLYVSSSPISSDTTISMEIVRKGKQVFNDSVQISKMKRTHTELAGFLFRECSFPAGCFLMTGTCIVPPNDFTLDTGDVVSIHIDHIGTLTNTIGKKK
jgi:2-dehydro-3-deoxy-D-arabinonate dehydratase